MSVAQLRCIGPAVTGGGQTAVPAPVAPFVTATSAAGDMSADIVGAAINIMGRPSITAETVWTDVGGAQDPVGVFSLEWSNEHDPITNPSVTFTTITLAAADITGMSPATTSGRYGIALTLAAKWLRPRYTRTSGAGTATCTVVAA
jgi:hypothetical protein